MAKSPMVESAVKVLEAQGGELTFNELWEKVIEDMQIDKETATKRIAKLYSNITLDKRFISLPDNKWDLRKRRKLDEIIIDTSDIIIEDEDDFELIDYDDEDYEYDDYDEESDPDKIEPEDIDDEEDLDLFDDELEIDLDLEEDLDEDISEFEELASASKD
ncbi:MAG: DNA-directed RNA polymerase subunit delta [Erysipelothrix sp.]|nr:DNA-directed RNA polymerase subunit delta [Erysipelothrix sp.]